MITDYGFDHHGPGQWKLVPSGEIVDKAGLDAWRASRPKRPAPRNDCLGLSWDEIERMQGGKLRQPK